jgi:hypothetical protein
VIRSEVDPAGTGGARCGLTTSRRHGVTPPRRGCGQPIRWGWVQRAGDTLQAVRIPLEPGPDPDGRLVQVGWRAGAPLVRALRGHETPPPGAKRWSPHAATCTAGRRPARRPRTAQLPLPLDDVQACPARRRAAVTAAAR